MGQSATSPIEWLLGQDAERSDGSKMHWSLSEFLNLIDLRGQSWCFIDLSLRHGFHVPRGEAVFFHAMLEGSARLSSGTGETIELNAGDIVMLAAGDAHTVRNYPNCPTDPIEMLNDGQYVDTVPTIHLGQTYPASRLISGRLKVLWPGGSYPNRLPSILTIPASESGIELGKFVRSPNDPGAAAQLTRLASLLFVSAFRNHPRCQALFHWNLDDPIARAKVLIERHPFQPWTVEMLGRKVGMGRSNFAARFTAQIGKTPIDVLTEERMKHAERFLQTTNLKIGEVSERVGYRSEAAFIRRFSDHFGMPPGKFRRQASTAKSGAPRTTEDGALQSRPAVPLNQNLRQPMHSPRENGLAKRLQPMLAERT